MRARMPLWLSILCCVTPLFALCCLAIAPLAGRSVSSAAMIAVVFLCNKITSFLLNDDPSRMVIRVPAD